MPGDQAVQFAEISDFSPGIHGENSSVIPPGAGHPDGTFGCFALPDGCLVPFPPRVIYNPPEDVITDSAGNLIEEVRITGQTAIGPIFLGGSGTQGADENHTGVVVAFEWWTDQSGFTATHHTELWLYHRDFDTPVWDQLSSRAPTGITFSALAIITVDILPTRSNNDDSSLAGPVVLAVCEFGPIYMFPDDTDPGTQATRWLPGDHANDPTMTSPVDISDDFIPVAICTHQGRLVTFMRMVTALGDNAFYDTDEQFFWSIVNDIRTVATNFSGGGVNYFKTHVGWEHPTGYGVMESLTADELLLIKKSGGAWILRGDLDNFQAVNYPFVRSTGESFNRGARTPRGFLYPVDGGTVWLWSGGQTSVEVAPQMDNDFWRVPVTPASGDDAGTTMDFFNYYTACASADIFTFCPNNWVWDSSVGDLGAWWRLEDPSDVIFHRWSSDWRGMTLYGTPSGVTTEDDHCFSEYVLTADRGTWSWLSHPVMPDQYEITLAELTVVGSGAGTIAVTAFTAEDPVGQTVTLTIDGTPSRPTTARAPLRVTGTNLQFQVVADSDGGEGSPAPHLHRLRWGWTESNLTPSS